MGRRSRKGLDEAHPVYNASGRHDPNTRIADRAFFQAEASSVTKCKVTKSRPKAKLVTPNSLDDHYAKWTPFHTSQPKDDQQLQDDPLEPSALSPEDDVPQDGPGVEGGAKRKRYINSDDPNLYWRPEAPVLLHELFRMEALGDSLPIPCCNGCGACGLEGDSEDTEQLYQCQDCSVLLYCSHCLLAAHRSMPLHRVKRWNGTYFEKTSLTELGLVYQLGHGGLSCSFPDDSPRNMVVIAINGIHKIKYRYCNCTATHRPSNIQQLMRARWYPATTTDPRTCATFDCLDHFRDLNVVGNVNANDFIKTLERKTDPITVDGIPDRYKTFSRVTQQWAALFRIKRSGHGFGLKALKDIPAGGLASRCWACPQVGFNLPKGWEKVDAQYSYLYMPVLALDANFRLQNRYRPKDKHRPALMPGSGYFVDPTPYEHFLSKYVSEKDVTTCVAFAALLNKDTKLTTGLRVSGVGGCACARHELVRPLGIGDLQKGERYANMDYIFFSAIRDLKTPRIAVSYDISCQWKTLLLERMKRLPTELHLQEDSVEFTFGLPTWHATAHEQKCKAANSLTYQDGVGRTDGEGIERIWSLLNSSSYATKEMGAGKRHDMLDDRIDYHNFTKNLHQGNTLKQRLAVAIAERDKQVAAFIKADQGLDPAKRATWKAMIRDWKADNSKPNPYLLPQLYTGPSENDVRESLKKADEAEAKAGTKPVYGTSASAFVVAGLQLEEIQFKIRRDAKVTGRSELQAAKVRDERCQLQELLAGFRELQHIYMPGAIRALKTQESSRSPNTDVPLPEETQLYLPSELSPQARQTGCSPDIADIELRLRAARCGDAISALRHNLHAKQYLIAFRNANVTGQRESGRARGLIESVTDRVNIEAEKYRHNRTALLALEGVPNRDFPDLLPADIQLDDNIDPDLYAIVKLGYVASHAHRRPHVSTGKKILSWIWTAGGGPDEQETVPEEYDSVRVEWAKALARKNRWTEEVEVLREEMKRVLRFLDNRVLWWRKKAPIIPPNQLHYPATAIHLGMRAYAHRQASVMTEIANSFRLQWGMMAAKD